MLGMGMGMRRFFLFFWDSGVAEKRSLGVGLVYGCRYWGGSEFVS